MSLIKGVPVFVVMVVVIVALLAPAFGQAAQQLTAPRSAQRAAQPQAAEVAPAAAAQAMRTAEEIEADIWNADLAHANDKHGTAEVTTVRNCLAAKGPAAFMWNPFTDRHASICLVKGNRVGVEIDEADGDFVTAFFGKGMRTIQELVDYLSEKGFLRQ